MSNGNRRGLHRAPDPAVTDGEIASRRSNEMHFVSGTCNGESCSICGAPATHKVGEEIPYNEPKSEFAGYEFGRHNFTAYVCCEHFGMIFGRVARQWCQDVTTRLIHPT